MQTSFHFNMVLPALPEMFLASAALILLLIGVFSPAERAAKNVLGLTLASFMITFMLLLTYTLTGASTFAFPYGVGEGGTPAGFMFVADFFSFYSKTLILLTSFLAVILAQEPLKRLKSNHFEFYILIILATIGMMVMASAQHLITLYMGLELMSFSLYILSAFQRDNQKSSEAGLKYFVMGSLASGVLLFGLSYLYGIVGDLSFATIATTITTLSAQGEHIPLTIALVLVLTAVGFKLSAAPFHMWTPDVYQGAPTPVTAFMSAGPKIAAFALLMRLLAEPFGALEVEWAQVITVLSILTMGVGSYMAIIQTNIKRLLAYSSIGHVGFMLVGVVAGTQQGVQAVLMYLTIYSMMTLGTFGLLMLLRRKNVYLETLEDLSGLLQNAPTYAFMMLIMLFSIAGIPPLAGFFAKFYVFSAAVNAGYAWLAVIGVLFSVVSAYYALRVIRTMFFDVPHIGKLDLQAPKSLYTAVLATTLFVVGYIFMIQPLNTVTKKAAESLTFTQKAAQDPHAEI